LSIAALVSLASCSPASPGGAQPGTSTSTADSSPATSETAADDADAFTEAHPDPGPNPPFNCAMATGVVEDAWLNIDGTEGDERGKLLDTKVVNGDVYIRGTDDTNLDFMECVEEITGSLYLYDNDALTDVSGLGDIVQIGGDVVIADNDALLDFDSLNQLSQIGPISGGARMVGPSLIVTNNDALASVTGLTSLSLVWGDIHVRDNPNLASLDGLAGLLGVGGTMSIVHNVDLCISSVAALVNGLSAPEIIPGDWSTLGNDVGC